MALSINIFLSLLVCHSVWARSPLIRPGVAVEHQNRNDLFGETTCKKVTLIFARGTFEPGNMGVLVGPDLENALAHELGENSLAVQGVAYPANIDGYIDGGDAEGANLLVSLVRRSLRLCPDSAVVLSGYSQGAQLIHRAARNLTVPETDMLKAVVMFGDPFDGQKMDTVDAQKVESFCHEKDFICKREKSSSPLDVFKGVAHLTYSSDVKSAATFIKERLDIS